MPTEQEEVEAVARAIDPDVWAEWERIEKLRRNTMSAEHLSIVKVHLVTASERKALAAIRTLEARRAKGFPQ